MISNKEINKIIHNILGLPLLYDIRFELTPITGYCGIPLGVAEEFIKNTDKDLIHYYTVTSSIPDSYTEDLNLIIESISKLLDKQDRGTFVLSYENGAWKAAIGNYGDCSEYKGANPAYVSCVALLKYFGKL